MKKLVCLLMAAMLLAALSVAVFARYEVCPDCCGRMKETTKKIKVGTARCEVMGEDGMLDYVYDITHTLTCVECGYTESYVEEDVQICTHH